MNTLLRRLGAFLLAVVRRLAPGKRARTNKEMDGVALPRSGAGINDNAGSALVTGTCENQNPANAALNFCGVAASL